MTEKKAPKSLPYAKGKWAESFAPRKKGEKRYWLIKSEPDVFSFDDLMSAEDKTTCWDSVRNSSARNFMRDGMKNGDKVFFYHSMSNPPAIVGVCEVVREGYPDATAFDRKSEYFDADSVAETPTWFMVDVKAVSKLKHPVALSDLKANDDLRDMALLRVSRLSVVPVKSEEWETIIGMSKSS